MNIISVLMFSFSASSDSFIIGVRYGSQKIKISFYCNLLIALISCIGTLIAMLFGKVLNTFINPYWANIIGSSLLILLGLYMLLNSFKSNKKNFESNESTYSGIECYENIIKHPEIIDINKSKTIEFKEAIILGGILCINNIALGIGASIAGLNIFITSLLSMIFSIVFVKFGCYIGNKIVPDKLSDFSEIISSCIIILLGVLEFFI